MYIEELNEETNLTEWRSLDESILATTGNFITEHTPELGIFTVFQDTRIVDLKETWITLAGDYNIRIDAENSRTRYKGSVDTFYYTFSLHCRVMSVDQSKLDDITYIIKSGKAKFKRNENYEQTPECYRNYTVSATIISLDQTFIGDEFPFDFEFSHSNKTKGFTIEVMTSDESHEGEYRVTLHYLIEDNDGEVFVDSQSVFSLNLINVEWPEAHNPPSYPNAEFPETVVLKVGDSYFIDSGKASADTASVDFSVTSAKQNWKEFMTHTIGSSSKGIKIWVDPKKDDDVGFYQIEVTLTDDGSDNGEGSLINEKLTQAYQILVQVVAEHTEDITIEITSDFDYAAYAKRVEACGLHCIPKMKLLRVNAFGEAEFSFNMEMEIPPDWQSWSGNSSFLENDSPLRVTLSPGYLQNATKLGFSWNLTEFNPFSLKM